MQGAVAATHMVQAFHKAGVPPGVINLVTGGFCLFTLLCDLSILLLLCGCCSLDHSVVFSMHGCLNAWQMLNHVWLLQEEEARLETT